MIDKSIAYRLSIYISLAVIGVFIAFIGIVFLFNLKIIKENVQNQSITESTVITSDVKKHIVSTKEITANVAGQIIFYNSNDYVQPFIEDIVNRYSFINAIHIDIDSSVNNINYHNYYCYKENDSIHFYKGNEPFETCISGSPEFIELQKEDECSWSEPLMCSRNMNVVVSYCNPIIRIVDNKPQKIGQVISELSLLELSESVNSIKIGENGFAILLSKKGEYITHPIKDWILSQNIYDVSKSVFDLKSIDAQKILQEGKTGSLIAYPEILNHEKSWVYYSAIEESGWMLLFVLPYKELLAPLYVPTLKMLFFSVLGILLIYILITYIANKQIQPLSSVATQLKNFSNISGEFHTESDSLNEIEQVTQSLNEIKLWYEDYKLRTSTAEKDSKIQKEDLLQASEIQKSLIKVDFPAFPNRDEIDLYAIYKPVRIVSGDLFDYFFRDNDHLLFTMGDVSGKGVPAAFFMSVAQTIIKTSSVGVPEVNEIVNRSNNELYTNNLHQFFLTLFLGVLNVKTGELEFCNAAHNTTYILKENGSVDRLTETHGLPLGLYHDKSYRQQKYQLEKGDSVVLYTDGVTELQDANSLQFGHDRFIGNIRYMAGKEPQEIVEGIESSLQLFLGKSPQNDDISVLVLKYYG